MNDAGSGEEVGVMQMTVHIPSLLAVVISPMFQMGIARAVRISYLKKNIF